LTYIKFSNLIERFFLSFQVVNEDLNGGVSSRRFRDNYLVVDDEDSPSNSNPANGLYIRNKVPPDKSDTILRNNGGAIEKVPKFNSKDGTSPGLNRTSLRLEELDFVPVCDIVAKETISAIHRAKTQLCKQKLANVTCLIQQRQLYPHHLPNSCPSPGNNKQYTIMWAECQNLNLNWFLLQH